jgi:hypothetical protein
MIGIAALLIVGLAAIGWRRRTIAGTRARVAPALVEAAAPVLCVALAYRAWGGQLDSDPFLDTGLVFDDGFGQGFAWAGIAGVASAIVLFVVLVVSRLLGSRRLETGVPERG